MTKNTNTTNTLEQSIVSALETTIPMGELTDLLSQIEIETQTIDQTLTGERDKLLDITLCRDPDQTRNHIAALETSRDRLLAMTPRLKAKLYDMQRAAAVEQWLADFDRVAEQRNSAAAAFQRYSELADAIIAIFSYAQQVDEQVSRINGSAPPEFGQKRLRSVELTARDLQQFTTSYPSLMTTCELRAFDESGKKLWPQRSATSFAAEFASGMVAPSHPGANWGSFEERERRRAIAEKENARMGAWHDEAQKTEEERINREAREQFAGPRRTA